MHNRFRASVLLTGVALAGAVGGCSQSSSRVKPPKIDPDSAAAQAVDNYDTNHDGKLTEAELAKCPGVLVAFERYDTNHDKAIDAEEFAEHLKHLLRNGTGATQLACTLTYQGRPLAGAKVVFEPESYLGTDIQAAEGTTDSSGSSRVGMPAEKAPAALQSMKLIQYGTFKVRVTHPSIQIPAKYNSETTLGYETIPGDPAVSFALGTK